MLKPSDDPDDAEPCDCVFSLEREISRRSFLFAGAATAFAAWLATVNISSNNSRRDHGEKKADSHGAVQEHSMEVEKNADMRFMNDGFDVQVGKRTFELLELRAGDLTFSRECLRNLIGKNGLTAHRNDECVTLDSTIGKGHIDWNDFHSIANFLRDNTSRETVSVSVRYRISDVQLPRFLQPCTEGDCTLLFREKMPIPDQFAQRPAESSH